MEQQTSGSLLTGGNPAPASQPAPAAAAAPGVLPTSTTAEPQGFYVPLNDEWKQDQSLSKFIEGDKLNVGSALKSYRNLESMLGREKIPVPKTDEDWDRWYSAAGRPEAPEKYEFKRPEKLPDGMPYDEDMEKGFRTWAHANGLNTKQANGLYDLYVKSQVDRYGAYYADQTKAKADAETALRREWGQGYDGKLALARGALREFAAPDFIAYLEQTGQANDPRMVKAFAQIGERTMGETALKGSANGAGMTPRDLDNTIAEMRSKNWEALSDRNHPDHARLNAEYSRLFQMRFPEER